MFPFLLSHSLTPTMHTWSPHFLSQFTFTSAHNRRRTCLWLISGESPSLGFTWTLCKAKAVCHQRPHWLHERQTLRSHHLVQLWARGAQGEDKLSPGFWSNSTLHPVQPMTLWDLLTQSAFSWAFLFTLLYFCLIFPSKVSIWRMSTFVPQNSHEELGCDWSTRH